MKDKTLTNINVKNVVVPKTNAKSTSYSKDSPLLDELLDFFGAGGTKGGSA